MTTKNPKKIVPEENKCHKCQCEVHKLLIFHLFTFTAVSFFFHIHCSFLFLSVFIAVSYFCPISLWYLIFVCLHNNLIGAPLFFPKGRHRAKRGKERDRVLSLLTWWAPPGGPHNGLLAQW